ncbi:cell division protein ZapE [Rickettsiales bacterium LUAb2]
MQPIKQLILDPEQQKLWNKLEKLRNFLEKKNKSWFNFRKSKGIYIYGSVGRGKTMLMNRFYHKLNISNKLRLHFQHFMKMIHEKLYEAENQKNAIVTVANTLAKNYQVICLDELYVEDIVNASIIANLLYFMYKKGMILVISTNLSPEQLFKNQDENYQKTFAKLIDLLKQNNEIFNLDTKQDYRLLYHNNNQVFFFDPNDQKLKEYFITHSNNTEIKSGSIKINDSQIIYKAVAKDIIWFDFKELCEKPRNQLEYITLANQFKHILISNIPTLDDGKLKGDNNIFNDDRSRRFINLIDEFYDRNTILYANFTCDNFNNLYFGERFKFEFQRIYSRLTEMQSNDYLTKT